MSSGSFISGKLNPRSDSRRPSSDLILAPLSLPLAVPTWSETFRVQNVPLNYSAEHVKNLFLPYLKPSIQVKSIARNLQAQQNPYHGSQTATIIFTSIDNSSSSPQLVDDEDADIDVDGDFVGLTPLNAPIEPTLADIVAVSGLTGNAFHTFSSSSTRNWLRDYLPQDVPNAQVWLYGYETDIDHRRPGDALLDKVDDFKSKLRQLISARTGCPRKIILIAHSIGCLVVQKALIELSHSYPNLHGAVLAIFFGAPNSGLSDSAFASLVAPNDPERIQNDLHVDADIIRSLQREFNLFASNMSILALYETKDSACIAKDGDGVWTSSVPHRIVNHKDASMYSATPTPCRNSDHFSMAQLKRNEQSAYYGVVHFIEQNIQAATYPGTDESSHRVSSSRLSTSSNYSTGGLNDHSSPYMSASTARTTPQSPMIQRDISAFQKAKFSVFPTAYVPNDGYVRPSTTYSGHSSVYSPIDQAQQCPIGLDGTALMSELEGHAYLPPPALQVRPSIEVTSLTELGSGGPTRAELAGAPSTSLSDLAELPVGPMAAREPSVSADGRGSSSSRKLSFGKFRISKAKSAPRTVPVDRTAMEWFRALHEDQLAEVKRLLQQDRKLLNMQDQDCENRCALHYAIENLSTSLFEFLMRRDGKPKFDLNLVTAQGESPLHTAAKCSNAHYAQSLLVKGAQQDIRDRHGNAPLHVAAAAGHANVVAAFVAAGASVSIRDGNGQTASDLAAQGGHRQVVKKLNSGGGKAVVSYPGLF